MAASIEHHFTMKERKRRADRIKKINTFVKQQEPTLRIRAADKVSYDDFCFPKKYELQKPQRFCGEVAKPGSPVKNLLVFYVIGAGKTCAYVRMVLSQVDHTKPIIVVPANLLNNTYGEFLSKCAGGLFISDDDKKRLDSLPSNNVEHRAIIARAKAAIDERMTITSYNKFRKLAPTIHKTGLLIMDEIHQLTGGGANYEAVQKYIDSLPAESVVCGGTGTPIFDNPSQMNYIFRLLRQGDVKMSAYIEDGQIIAAKRAELAQLFSGFISYFAGAPAYTFPKTIVKYVKLTMSPFQRRAYDLALEEKLLTLDDVSESNSFYNKSLATSMIAYPTYNATQGQSKLVGAKLLRPKIAKYSCKIDEMLRIMRKGIKGIGRTTENPRKSHMLIFCKFKGLYGAAAIRKVLLANGYKDFRTDGPGRDRFAIWSGEESRDYKRSIVETYNSRDNDNLSRLQFVIGTMAMRDGVSFFRTGRIIMMTPPWSKQAFDQIVGRGSRYCSHKTVSRNYRVLYVHILVSCVDSRKTSDKETDPVKIIRNSVDDYIYYKCNEKNKIISDILDIAKANAIDKRLFQSTGAYS